MRAFTLIELLITISIIGIISLISLPIYKTLIPNIDLNSTVRDVASDLRYAQQMAVTEQIIYSVIFDSNYNRYSIIKNNTNEVIKTKNLPSTISINFLSEFSGNKVQFIATGAAIESGSISFINTKAKILTIEIKPSGYVKIQQ